MTIAHRAIDAALRAGIAVRFPAHGIFGEEMGVKEGDGLCWVIDPIDRPKSFVTGLPLSGTLIALLESGRPVLGVIDMPALGECWAGGPDGTMLNGVAARDSQCCDLLRARFFTAWPEGFVGTGLDACRRLMAGTGIRRFGGDCYAYGRLASGHCDLVAECGLQPYDYMALVPVIRGAGGVVSDWNGEEPALRSGGRVLAAATPALHARALDLVRAS